MNPAPITLQRLGAPHQGFAEDIMIETERSHEFSVEATEEVGTAFLRHFVH